MLSLMGGIAGSMLIVAACDYLAEPAIAWPR